MRSFVICAVLLTLAVEFSAAQTATVVSASGRVETRVQGGPWRPIAAGDRLPVGADISTAFHSRATIDIGGNLVHVEPLTRVAIASFVRDDAVSATELNLRVGRVAAEVRTAEGLSQEFRLRSTQSTASVRGTRFVFDGSELKVLQGKVQLSNLVQQTRTVRAGQVTRSEQFKPPERSETVLQNRTQLTTRPVDSGGGTVIRRIRPRPSTGSVRVLIRGEGQ